MVTYDHKSVGQIIKSHVHTVKTSYTLIPASSLYHCILCILPTEGKILSVSLVLVHRHACRNAFVFS